MSEESLNAIETPTERNNIPEIISMEVHHHPHVGKKNFKEYLLEGLMIFVAVSMGFIAENFREHLVNNEKEKEYVQSFYSDLSEDEKSLPILIHSIQLQQIQPADSLKLLSDSLNTGKYDGYIYNFLGRLLRQQGIHAFVTDRTMDEIKNAGEMRLLKNRAITDSLLDYYKDIVLIDYFQNVLLGYKSKMREEYPAILSAKEYNTLFEKGFSYSETGEKGKFHLLHPDAVTLNRLFIQISDVGSLSDVIQRRIKGLRLKAIEIKKMIKQNYQVKTE